MNASDFNRSMEIVEDALQTFPLAPVPGRLRSRVMQRVRSSPAAPRFVFPWLEAAISLMLSTLLTGGVYLVIGIPPATLMRLQQSIRFFFALPAYRPIIPAALAGLGMLVVCALLALRLFRPRSRAHLTAVRMGRS